MPIRARDGCVLSAAVYLPAGDGAWPAVIDCVPYRKDDDFLSLDWDTYGNLAAYGFACVRLDVRGTGSSEGVVSDEYSVQELDDLEDAIAAVAASSWCTGRVGATGVSWGGFNCVQVAMRRPAALSAIAPIHWSHDRYRCDVHYVGGSLQVRECVSWPGSMIVENALPPDPAIVGGEAFDELWRLRLEQTPQWPFEWLRHQRRDAYWRHGSLCEDWLAITCPVLAIGGWHDGYRDACLAVLEHGAMPRRAVIGPWGHARPNRGWPGAPIDHRAILAGFFGHWLDGRETGEQAQPLLTAFVLDGQPAETFPATVPGAWRSWSALRGDELRLDLATLEGPGLPATWRGPQSVGGSMPWWCGGSGPPAGYGGDMRGDDAGSLCFDAVIDEPVTLLGKARLRASVSADAPVALLAVRLEHVRADGSSSLICRGSLNLTHRSSDESPTSLEPGRPVDVEVALMAAGIALPLGDRLRIALAGADWPIAWPPPTPVTLTVHSAVLLLPTPPIAHEVPVPALPQPIDHVGDPVSYREADEPVWQEVDKAGLRRIRTVDGWDCDLPDGGRSAGSEEVVCEIRDDDPTGCRAIARHTAVARHGDCEASARSRIEMSCTTTHFHLEIDLAVDRDGRSVFQRSWVEDVRRELM